MSYGVNLHQAEAGKKSIGAVATEKVQSDALNLGFPSVYSSVYASRGIAPRYFPQMRPETYGQFWRGSDLMSHIHEERRKDADYMAGAKVRSTQLSRVRYVGTPHGMGILPKAVLGQRLFANPSQGALATASAREDQNGPFRFEDAEGSYSSVHTPLPRDTQGLHQVPLVGDRLTGGVLRTMVGQQHGRKVLTDRINQLNTIETTKQEFANELPMTANFSERVTETPVVGENAAIELSLLLQGVIDAVVGGEAPPDSIDHLSAFTMKDATRALALIFRLAPQMDQNSLDDTFGKVDLIINSVNGILDPDEDTTISSQSREIALTLQVLFTKLRVYLEKMIEGRNLSSSERLSLSKALVNSLGFSKMLKYSANDYNSMLSSADQNNLFTAQQYQRYRQGDMGVDGDGSSWGDDDDDFFDRPAGPREDEEHEASTGVSRSDRDFTPDVRQEFGTQSGLFFPNGGRGDRGFFGEVAQGLMGDVTVERRGPPPPQELPLEARPPPRASQSVASSATRVPQAQLSSYWDADTQAFNVATQGRRPPPPSIASRSTATRSVGVNALGIPVKRYNKLPTRLRQQNEAIGRERNFLNPRGEPKVRILLKPEVARAIARAPAGRAVPQVILPTSQSQLPTTREGFDELAKAINRTGGINGSNIQVYAGSSVANIRKNFVKRLGLAGKY